MKTKQILAVSIILSISFFTSISHADDITAISSGNWSDTNIWDSGTVPGTNDDIDVPAPFNVTVDTNEGIQYIYDDGTVTMSPNSTLSVIGNSATDGLSNLVATATGNTVAYLVNPFYAKECDYYNLVFADTNYVDPYPPFYPYEYFNNFSRYGPTPMTIAGNMTVNGYIDVQLGAPVTIGGNLVIGTNCLWDCSDGTITVTSNTVVYGELTDGSGDTSNLDDSFNNLTIGATVPGINQTNGVWDLSDVIEWSVSGSLTNNGTIKEHSGPSNGGSITFVGAGVITGNPFQVSDLFLKGTNTIGTTVTVTNFLGLAGTVVFDLANPQKLILTADSTNALTYGGVLNVINTGPALTSGTSYQIFSASAYGGSFTAINLPPLPNGLSWVTNLATSGSIAVTGTATGSSPIITSFHYDPATLQFTLTWTSTSDAMYTVQETPSLNPASWNNLQQNIPSGGSTTTYTVTMPTGTKGFLRILQQ